MKKALVSVLFLFAFSSLFSQTFSLTDTNIVSGGYYRSYSIFFDLGKATLNPTCFSNLDSVVTFLNNNPSIKIEIGFHADLRTTKNSCTNLSSARAKSIADYFISKGVSPDRLLPKGYSSFKPIIPQKSIDKLKTKEEIEVAHQKNRRVEYRILAI